MSVTVRKSVLCSGSGSDLTVNLLVLYYIYTTNNGGLWNHLCDHRDHVT